MGRGEHLGELEAMVLATAARLEGRALWFALWHGVDLEGGR